MQFASSPIITRGGRTSAAFSSLVALGVCTSRVNATLKALPDADFVNFAALRPSGTKLKQPNTYSVPKPVRLKEYAWHPFHYISARGASLHPRSTRVYNSPRDSCKRGGALLVGIGDSFFRIAVQGVPEQAQRCQHAGNF